jgi:hypothetical protein
MKTKTKKPSQPLDHYKKARLAYFQGVASVADVKRETVKK